MLIGEFPPLRLYICQGNGLHSLNTTRPSYLAISTKSYSRQAQGRYSRLMHMPVEASSREERGREGSARAAQQAPKQTFPDEKDGRT
jgi:hypothetical protein